MESTAMRRYRWNALPGTVPIPWQEAGLLSQRASTGSIDVLFAMPHVSEWTRRGLQADLARPVRARSGPEQGDPITDVSPRDAFRIRSRRFGILRPPALLGHCW